MYERRLTGQCMNLWGLRLVSSAADAAISATVYVRATSPYRSEPWLSGADKDGLLQAGELGCSKTLSSRAVPPVAYKRIRSK
jgi:hypothetical protein